MKDSITFSTIRKNSEIATIFQTGFSLSNDCFIVNYLKTANEYKFAISVNKKIFKTAVQRNKIKRQVRTFVRKIVNPKPIKFLIIVKKQYLKNTYNSNNLLFQNLLQKVIN